MISPAHAAYIGFHAPDGGPPAPWDEVPMEDRVRWWAAAMAAIGADQQSELLCEERHDA